MNNNDENNVVPKDNKVVRYICYAIVIALCIIAIFLGVYQQFYADKTLPVDKEIPVEENSVEDPVVTIRQGFLDLFENEVDDSTVAQVAPNVQKINPEEGLVVKTSKTFEDKDKYKINVNIPYININSDAAQNYNKETQTKYVDQINSIITNTSLYTTCDISYTGYINNGILSIAILERMKIGENPQTLSITTYNYDLNSNQNLVFSDIMTKKGLDENAVNKKIKAVIDKSSKDNNSLSNLGNNLYQRDENNEMYKISNIQNFILGPNGELYIIFAYGNQSNTDQIDIVKI